MKKSLDSPSARFHKRDSYRRIFSFAPPSPAGGVCEFANRVSKRITFRKAHTVTWGLFGHRQAAEDRQPHWPALVGLSGFRQHPKLIEPSTPTFVNALAYFVSNTSSELSLSMAGCNLSDLISDLAFGQNALKAPGSLVIGIQRIR